MVRNHDQTDAASETSRRSVLKAVGSGAALAAAPAFAGTVSAKQVEHKRAEYATAESAHAALEAHGQDTLEALAERGLIAEASLSTFRTDRMLPGDATGVEGVQVTAEQSDAGLTGHVVATKTTGDSTIRLVARPEAGESFAVVDPDDGEEFVVESSGDVGTLDCQYFKTEECKYDECGVCLGTIYKMCCQRDGSCRTMYSTGECCGQKDSC